MPSLGFQHDHCRSDRSDTDTPPKQFIYIDVYIYLWVRELLVNSPVETIKMSMEAADRFGGHKAECLFGPRMVYAAVGWDEILTRPDSNWGR